MLKTGLPANGISGKQGKTGHHGLGIHFGKSTDFLVSGLEYLRRKVVDQELDEEDDYQKYLIRIGQKKSKGNQVYRRLYINPKDIELFNPDGTIKKDVHDLMRSKLSEWNAPNSPYYVYGYPYGTKPRVEDLIPVDGNPRHYFYSEVDFRTILSRQSILKPNVREGDDVFVLTPGGLKKFHVGSGMEKMPSDQFNRILQGSDYFIQKAIWARKERLCFSTSFGLTGAGRNEERAVRHFKSPSTETSLAEYLSVLHHRGDRFANLSALPYRSMVDVDVSTDSSALLHGTEHATVSSDKHFFRMKASRNGILMDVEGVYVAPGKNEEVLNERDVIDPFVNTEVAKSIFFPIEFDASVIGSNTLLYEDRAVCKVGISVKGGESSISFAFSSKAVAMMNGYGFRIMVINTSTNKFLIQPTDFTTISGTPTFTVKMRAEDIAEMYKDLTKEKGIYTSFVLLPYAVKDGIRVFKAPIERSVKIEVTKEKVSFSPIQQYTNKSKGSLGFVTDANTLIDTSLGSGFIPPVEGAKQSISETKEMKILHPTAKNTNGSIISDNIVKLTINGVEVKIAGSSALSKDLYYADGRYSGVQKVTADNITTHSFFHFKQPYYTENGVVIPYIYGKNIPQKYANVPDMFRRTNQFFQKIEETTPRILNLTFTTSGGRVYEWSIEQPAFEDERLSPTMSFEAHGGQFTRLRDDNLSTPSNTITISNHLNMSNLNTAKWREVSRMAGKSEVFVALLCRMGELSPFMESSGSVKDGKAKLTPITGYGKHHIMKPFVSNMFSTNGGNEPMEVSTSVIAGRNVILSEGKGVKLDKMLTITDYTTDKVPFAIIRDKNVAYGMSQEMVHKLLSTLVTADVATNSSINKDMMTNQIGVLSLTKDMTDITAVATVHNGRYESGFFILISPMAYVEANKSLRIALNLSLKNPTYSNVNLPLSVDRMMFFTPAVSKSGDITLDTNTDVLKVFNYLNEEPILMDDTDVESSTGVTKTSSVYGKYIKSSITTPKTICSIYPLELGLDKPTKEEVDSIVENGDGTYKGPTRNVSIHLRPYLMERVLAAEGMYNNELNIPRLSTLYDSDTALKIMSLAKTDKTLLTLSYKDSPLKFPNPHASKHRIVVYNGKTYELKEEDTKVSDVISLDMFTEDMLSVRSFWNTEFKTEEEADKNIGVPAIPSSKHVRSNGYMYLTEVNKPNEVLKRSKKLPLSLEELQDKLSFNVLGISSVKEDKVKGEVYLTPMTYTLGDDCPLFPLFGKSQTSDLYKWRDKFTSSVTLSPRVAQYNTGLGLKSDEGRYWILTLRDPS